MTAGPRAARLSTRIQDREVTAVGKAEPQVIEDDEHQRVFGRVAAVDVAKATGMVCVRLPRQDGGRYSKVWEVTATMGAVTGLARQLVKDRIEMVTLEATSDYWRIFYYVLEMCGLRVQLVSPSQARNLKGRPKTDPLTEPRGVTAAQRTE
jgi:transposase